MILIKQNLKIRLLVTTHSISHQPQSNENNINPLATSENDENGESDSNAK